MSSLDQPGTALVTGASTGIDAIYDYRSGEQRRGRHRRRSDTVDGRGRRG
jgi:hypothetical protein